MALAQGVEKGHSPYGCVASKKKYNDIIQQKKHPLIKRCGLLFFIIEYSFPNLRMHCTP